MTSPRHSKPEKKMAKWKRVLLIIGCVLLGLILIVSSVFGILWLRGRSALLPGNVSIELPADLPVENDITDDQIIIYNGEKYTYNYGMTAVLCMGTDKTADQTAVGNGQADSIFLVAIDTGNGKTTVINISRDIMAEIGVYDQSGNYIGIEKHQICLAHAYGSDEQTGCDNTVTAVSRLLYGIPINTYFSIDWASTPLLTQSVGGVTVPAYDDEWNPTGGTVTLTESDTMRYLRGRRSDIVDANNGRMDRQIGYLKAFVAKAVEQSRSDPTFPLKLFDTLDNYSTNNVNASRIAYLSTVFLSNGAQLDFRSVAGEVTMGEEYAEMYVDQQALLELILEVFYQKVE